MKKISELISLEGRKAIVTGGAGHIGLAICEALIELGADVCVLDLDKQNCDKICEVLNGMNLQGRAIPVQVNLSDENETRQSIIDSANIMDGIDILVHCAAFVGTTDFPGWAVPFKKQTVEAWDAAIRINLTSAFTLAQTALPYLEKSKNGSVVFISSIYGVVGQDIGLYAGTDMVTPTAYAASKGGLVQLTRHLATVLAPTVRVNTITAGGVFREQPKLFHQRYIDKTPLKRMAQEMDFKGAVAYLASDLSNYVTGSNLVVDGGWTIC